MSLAAWLAFVGAVLVLMSTPGPSHLLMMSNALANGFRRARLTAAGDLSANMLQMLAAGLGLGVLVAASETAFAVIKWGGVAYLVWIGAMKIRRAGTGGMSRPQVAGNRALFVQGFVTSAANPKAVVFFAALFPQFITSAGPFWTQFAILSATYIAIDAAFLSLYGGSASWLARRLSGPRRLWLDRASGGALILAAVLLGLKSVPSR